jgi:hypothetical protein
MGFGVVLIGLGLLLVVVAWTNKQGALLDAIKGG